MFIIEKKLKLSAIRTLEPVYFDDMVKGVVDIEKRLVSLHAEMHCDCEDMLLKNGSKQENLIGFNIYFDDGEIELDSNINPPVNRRLGFPRDGRLITEPNTVKLVSEILREWVIFDV